MPDKTFNANDVKDALAEAGVFCHSAQIAVMSGKDNKNTFQISALFYTDPNTKPQIISVQVGKDVTKNDLPKIVEDLKAAYNK